MVSLAAFRHWPDFSEIFAAESRFGTGAVSGLLLLAFTRWQAW